MKSGKPVFLFWKAVVACLQLPNNMCKHGKYADPCYIACKSTETVYMGVLGDSDAAGYNTVLLQELCPWVFAA